MRSIRSPWVRFGFLGCMALIVAAFLFLDPILRSSVKRDLVGAAPQQGVATVVILVVPDPVHNEMDVKPQVSVRFRNQICSAKDVWKATDLKLDQPAQIEYRIGKSGRIYVDSVEPLSTAAHNEAPAAP